MINVNQMTAAFAKMPDAALKQYAMMHKNDPYTVSLVMSESNRRKQIRGSAQGQAAQQPTVVDQELAQMGAQPAPQMPQGQAQPMPENVGIGTLPQPHMQSMAEGGIVAFGGGGETDDVLRKRMERDRLSSIYSGEVSVEDLDADGKAPGALTALGAFGDVMTLPARGVLGILNTAGVRPLRALGLNVPYIPEKVFGGDSSSLTPYTDQLRRAEAQYAAAKERERNMQIARVQGENMRPTMVGDPRLLGVSDPIPGAGAPAGLVNAPPAAKPPADKGGIKTLVAAPRAPATAVAPAPAVAEKSYEEYFKDSMKAAGKETDPFEEDTKKITASAKKGKEDELTAFRRDILAENAEMFKGREERIGKREVALEKSKDTNTGMAFLQAGLAMMQARGPGLAGIAQGAGVGLGVYGAGIDKIKSAQEKLDESRDRIDELRQNKSSMDKREIRAKESGISDLVTQGERDLLAGKKALDAQARALAGTFAASSVATGQSALDRKHRADESALERKQRTEDAALDRQNRIAVAGMPGDQQRMLTMLGGKGGLEAGLAKMQEIQADKTGAAYAKMFTEARADAIKNGAEPPTAVAFAASLRSLAAALNPGKVPALSDTPTGAVRP